MKLFLAFLMGIVLITVVSLIERFSAERNAQDSAAEIHVTPATSTEKPDLVTPEYIRGLCDAIRMAKPITATKFSVRYSTGVVVYDCKELKP